ncbi:MAG: nitroreductase family protein [Chloroflexota bacterium]
MPSTAITTIMQQRYSCRNYQPVSIPAEIQSALRQFITALPAGPFGTEQRFELAAAAEDDRSALKKLGTYGYIKNPPGFIIGATRPAELDLEDYGYQMEKIILEATRLGLGTCWLGGTFTKSSFHQKISAEADELVPAVTALGLPADRRRWIEIIRRRDQNIERREPFETLFFEGDFSHPLVKSRAGEYAVPLEMVRQAPSASNKQPWRIVRDGSRSHLYLQRTPGYRDDALVKWVTVADMQRLDMGIAMLHYQLSAEEIGLAGDWKREEPGIQKPDALTEYVVSWVLK